MKKVTDKLKRYAASGVICCLCSTAIFTSGNVIGTVPQQVKAEDDTSSEERSDENNETEQKEETVKCIKIKAEQKTYTIQKVGKDIKVIFTLTTTPKNSLTKEKVTAKIKNAKIAKITEKTLSENKLVVSVQGIKNGKTTLTVNVGKKSAKTTISVKMPGGMCGENLFWEQKGTILTIKGTGKMKNYSTGNPFENRNIKKIVISSGVTSIGRVAFSGLEKLKNVKISNTVQTIGKHAFGGCISLTSITIPKSVQKIENRAFMFCDKLKTIKILSKNCKICGNKTFGYYIYKVDLGKSKEYYKLISGVKIYGLKGSTAEKYAKKHKIPFITIKG